MKATILWVVAIATTASPSKAERAPIACQQFIASLSDGGKTYDAPPLTVRKTIANENRKDTELRMFPDVYMGLSCLNGRLDTFEVMADYPEQDTVVRAGATMAIAMHALGMDWKGALDIRNQMIREMSKKGRTEAIVDGAKIRLHHGVTGIPVFQIEYPDH